MEENQKKIEEQQKKMVRFFFYCNVWIFFILSISGRGPAEDDRGSDEDRSGEAEAEEEGGQKSEVGAENDFGKRQLPTKTFFRFC